MHAYSIVVVLEFQGNSGERNLGIEYRLHRDLKSTHQPIRETHVHSVPHVIIFTSISPMRHRATLTIGRLHNEPRLFTPERVLLYTDAVEPSSPSRLLLLLLLNISKLRFYLFCMYGSFLFVFFFFYFSQNSTLLVNHSRDDFTCRIHTESQCFYIYLLIPPTSKVEQTWPLWSVARSRVTEVIDRKLQFCLMLSYQQFYYTYTTSGKTGHRVSTPSTLCCRYISQSIHWGK